MLGGAVLALLLAGYFAQQYLPPPKPKVVGIDLGEILRHCLSVLILILSEELCNLSCVYLL